MNDDHKSLAMKEVALFILLIFILPFIADARKQLKSFRPEFYGTGKWDADSLGNHRAMVSVTKSTDIVLAHLPWRRRDFNPQLKSIIIVDAATGHTVKNILPVNINREYGDILFQPQSVPGQYYIYYLKYKSGGRSNYPNVKYPPFISAASPEWLSKATAVSKNLEAIPQATLIQFQAIDNFNSFYPMELIATSDEVNNLLRKNQGIPYLAFTESRENPIRMIADLPVKWINDGPWKDFTGKARKGEYFTFQIGVYPVTRDMEDIRLSFSGLKKSGKTIVIPGAFTCFNLEGIDWEGKLFVKSCAIRKNKVQPLWIGVQIPENIEAGDYVGDVKLLPANMPEKVIRLKILIEDIKAENSGDDDPYRLTRLRWLNSTIGNDDGTVTPYTPLEVSGRTIKCLGREVSLNKLGLPESIRSHFSESVTRIVPVGREMLSAPVEFIVMQDQKKAMWGRSSFNFTNKTDGKVTWEIENETSGLKLNGRANMEADGNIDYQFILTATTDTKVSDIRLEIPFKTDVTKYMMGLGQKGGYCPKEFNWKWKVENNQDGPWVGDVNAGLQVRFRDNHYSRPLNTNFYLSKPLIMPDSWYNNNRGGITIAPSGDKTVMLTSFSGEREIRKGEQLHFYFNLLITPFHTLDLSEQWHDRYFHSYKPIGEIIHYGANTINIHHANAINPFINYPFLRPQLMKSYIDSAHAAGLKAKIYYTVRELSNRAPELFMLRSLRDEVLSYGKGGGFAWLQEHLDSGYIAAWFVPELKDAAIINTGISRWHNYYVEGLNWLVKNVGIDGLYIDDIAFDRTTMKRVRKILIRNNPEALIDVHSANQFNPRDGFANSANLYMEHFPYIDRLWFGEYFNYDYPPDFWLVETSGIPFGLMGEMLEKGGNPWRGMVFGMTARAPWSGNPAPLWKFWDQYGIQQAEMIGYWDSNNPVSTNNEKVKATVYLKKNEALIAVASWDPADTNVKFTIEAGKLGFIPKSAVAEVVAIENFQPGLDLDLTSPVTIPGGKGYLMIIR